MTAFETAKRFIQMGIPVVPLHGTRTDGSCRCKLGFKCENSGKHPMKGGWQANENLIRTESALVDVWNNEAGQCNFGAAWGHPLPDGRIPFAWDVDVDHGKTGKETMMELQLEGKKLPQTMTIRTGGGGVHMIMALPAGAKVQNHNPLLPGVDIRGLGGQSVLPGSKSGKGNYTLLLDVEIANAQAWTAELLEASSTPDFAVPVETIKTRVELTAAEIELCDKREAEIIKRVVARLDKLKGVPAGSKPSWGVTTWGAGKDLLRLANSPWSKLTADEAMKLVFDHAPRDAAFTDTTVATKIKSAVNCVKGHGLEVPKIQEFPPRSWDDFGNADRLVDHCSDRMCWVIDAQCWAIYDDEQWHFDAKTKAGRVYREMVEALSDTEATKYPDVKDGDKASQREKFMTYVKTLRFVDNRNKSLNAAQDKKELEGHRADFDSDRYLLGVKNGVLNLKTGELLPRSAEHRITRWVDVDYVPEAECPKFLKYLARVQPEDECRNFLQRWSGYCLSGDMTEQRFAILYGPPGGGKGVYFEVMSKICGGNYVVANPTVFLSKTNDGHPTELASLAGARFIQANEIREGGKLDESKVTALTSHEPISARFINENEFRYPPTGKINYAVNHRPAITAHSGVWRRLILMAWDVQITESEKIKDLGQRLGVEEAEGILAWAVRGFDMWMKSGLEVPTEWELEKSAYEEEEDWLGQFLADECEPDQEAFLKSADLYPRLQKWGLLNGVKNIPENTVFGKRMAEYCKVMGVMKPGKNKKGARGYHGLKLKPETTPIISLTGGQITDASILDI